MRTKQPAHGAGSQNSWLFTGPRNSPVAQAGHCPLCLPGAEKHHCGRPGPTPQVLLDFCRDRKLTVARGAKWCQKRLLSHGDAALTSTPRAPTAARTHSPPHGWHPWPRNPTQAVQEVYSQALEQRCAPISRGPWAQVPGSGGSCLVKATGQVSKDSGQVPFFMGQRSCYRVDD